MLEAGRAAHRFLDAFKAAVTREKNEDGTSAKTTPVRYVPRKGKGNRLFLVQENSHQ